MPTVSRFLLLRLPASARQLALRVTLFGLLAVALAVPLAAVAASDDIDVSGQVVIEHADDFVARRAEHFTVLETERGRFRLEGAKASELKEGTRVRVRGKQRGGTIVLGDSGSVTTLASTSSSTSSTSGSTVKKRVAVLLINFTDPLPPPSPTPDASASPTPDPSASPTPDPSASPTASPSLTPSPSPTPTPTPPAEPWTKSSVNGLFFTNTRSVASYFAEVSNGKMAISGDVFGYYTLAADTTKCDYGAWGTAARQAATAAGVDLSTYQHVVHAFPRQSSCSWGGLGQLPGKYTWINGSMTIYVTVHELGHNFGAHHAATLNCTKSGTRVTLSSSCTLSEYGDPFDVMGQNATGRYYQRHVQAWHRRQLGLLGTSDQLTVTTNGTYAVSTAQAAGGVPRILRVARPSGDYYYIESRQPYGLYDDFSSSAYVVNGVLVRIAPDSKRVQSRLLDMNPGTSSFSDAALAVGQTFADPANNISITTVSVGASGASVRVEFGPDSVAPSAVADLSWTVTSADSITLSWSAATDDVGVKGYRVSRDGAPVATVSGTSYTDSGLVSSATYAYEVVAFDAAGNVGLPAGVSVQLKDGTPPSAPASVSVVQAGSRSVSLSWTAATDNVGVVEYRVRRNGQLLAKTTGTSFEDTSVIDGYSYEYAVRAVDAAGNLGPFRATEPAKLSLPDVTAPSAPGSLSSLAVSSTSSSLEWSAASDNVAVAGYRVARDGVLVATLGATATTFGETGLAPGVYFYSVIAFDAAGNNGAALNSSVELRDTTPPSVPQQLTGKSLDRRYIRLTWQASTDDSGGTIRYRIFRNGVRIATVTGTSFRDRPATIGTYSYKIRAVDASRNKSAFTPSIKVKAVRRA